MKFFDLDGTICESKQKISPEMKAKLQTLDKIAVISGADREQMEWQLDGLNCYIMAQSGNECLLWYNGLTKEEEAEIVLHIKNYCPTYDDYWHTHPEMRPWEEDGTLDFRGCQVSYSFTGHHADQVLKNAYDPDRKKRLAILKQYPFKSKTLEVKVAGTTCLDYLKKNGTKGKNIRRWIKEKGLNKDECVFYGDALFKGGNDESVIGVIKTVAVKNPSELLNIL